jgi:hypothetical protein
MAQVAYVIEEDGALVVQWLPDGLLTPAGPQRRQRFRSTASELIVLGSSGAPPTR